ncbi:Cupredoxin [Mycena crocata]|nr:Cupredoxin [Mycena crocata]
MRFASLVVSLAAAAVASAQDPVKVAVGGTSASPGGIFQFNPSQIKAPKGTVVTFEFSGIPGNHSVTQSSFASPCQPLAGGFDSGWIEILANTTTLPTWELTVTDDSKAIWFYCKQLQLSPHCTAGMVGAINVQPGENTFEAFQGKAKGDSAPGQGQNGLVGVGASASAQPNVGSGATQHLGAALGGASAGASGGAASGTGAPPAESSTPSGALALGINFSVVALFGVFAAGAMIL